jgi:ribulose-5-phosphate 4-epimerase/fuculose-1-phosphate aldolase
MNESQAREEICRIGQSLYQRGYVHATAGNISARLDDGFLITPTDACLGFLDPAALSRLDAQGRQLSGAPASKTIALHTAIYRAAAPFDPNTRCIIHTHSTHSVALSLRCSDAELLSPITPYFVMKVGHVPLLRYQRPGGPAVAQEVAQLIAQYGQSGRAIRAVMLARLGPNVWHDSPAAAMAVLEELEETARLVLLESGAIAPLDETQIDELRRSFGARW